MLRSGLSDYSDTYIFVSRIITVSKVTAGGRNRYIRRIFKKCSPFADSMSDINNAQADILDNAKNIDIVISTYYLIEYYDNHSKISRSLSQYYGDEPMVTDADAIDNFLVIVFCLNFNQKYPVKWEIMVKKLLQ